MERLITEPFCGPRNTQTLGQLYNIRHSSSKFKSKVTAIHAIWDQRHALIIPQSRRNPCAHTNPHHNQQIVVDIQKVLEKLLVKDREEATLNVGYSSGLSLKVMKCSLYTLVESRIGRYFSTNLVIHCFKSAGLLIGKRWYVRN